MNHHKKQFIIYLCQAWAMPFFLILIVIGKIGTFLEWMADNGIDEMNYRFFIPSKNWLDKHIKDSK